MTFEAKKGNPARSEHMRAYWAEVAVQVARTGYDIPTVRAMLKNHIVPTKQQNHYTGKRYHYVARVKGKPNGGHVTIVSNRPLTKKQIKSRAADIFNINEGEKHGVYGSTSPVHWDMGAFIVNLGEASIDTHVEVKTKSTHDWSSQAKLQH